MWQIQNNIDGGKNMSIDSGKFCSSLFVKYKNPTQYRNDKLHELRKDFFITPTPEEHIKLMAANTEIAIDNVIRQIICDHLED